MNEHDPTRLPKWAQRELAVLRRERDEWRDRCVGPPAPDANTFVEEVGDSDHPGFVRRPLGRDEGIVFVLREGREVRARVNEYGELYVNAPEGGLLVSPRAHNALHLEVRR